MAVDSMSERRDDGDNRATGPMLSGRLVGCRAMPVEIVVDPRHAANFAAAIGDENPRYLDDRDPASLIAPPMLAVALTATNNQGIGAAILQASGLQASAFDRQLHFTEILEFHAPLKPGALLRLESCLAALRPHRSGVEFVLRFAAFEAEKPIFTEHLGVLARGIQFDGEHEEALPGTPALQRGADVPPAPQSIMDHAITRSTPYVYDACSGISFPLHTSRKFANAVGFDDIILHGTANLTFAVRDVIDQVCEGDPTRLKNVSVQFAGMVRPGSALRVRRFAHRVSAGFLDVPFDAIDESGRPVLRYGRALIEPA